MRLEENHKFCHTNKKEVKMNVTVTGMSTEHVRENIHMESSDREFD